MKETYPIKITNPLVPHVGVVLTVHFDSTPKRVEDDRRYHSRRQIQRPFLENAGGDGKHTYAYGTLNSYLVLFNIHDDWNVFPSLPFPSPFPSPFRCLLPY